MDEREVRGLVKGWYRRARAERDVVSRFVFLWFCFNAWLAFESNEDRDRAMINWLKGAAARRSQLRASFDVAAEAATSLFPGYLKTLADMSPITSTGRTYREARVTSADDFGGVVAGHLPGSVQPVPRGQAARRSTGPEAGSHLRPDP